MVDVAPDNTPDEVEQLAGALYDWNWDNDGSGPVRVSLEQMQGLARAAAAIGARTALEDAARDYEANGLTSRRLLDRAAPYTTDEETTHSCETCQACIHDGNKCCGCYDGACCQEPTEEEMTA